MRLQKLTCIILVSMLFSATVQAQSYKYYTDLSDSFFYAEKYDTALLYSAKADVIVQKDSGENSVAYAYFLGQYYAFIYDKMNDIKNAVYWYKRSINIFEKLNDTLSTEYAETLVNYGNISTNIGSYAEARKYLVKAERILRNYPEQLNSYGGAINNLANVYSYLGEYSKAEGAYLDLLKLIEKTLKSNDNYYSAILYGNLGLVYSKTGLWKNTEQCFIKGRNILKKIPANKYQYCTINLNLGELYALEKNAPAAKKIFGEMIDSLSEGGDTLLYASALNGMAQVMEQQQKPVEAEAGFLSSLRVLRNSERGKRIYYSVGYNLASFYKAQNKLSESDSLFRSLLQSIAKETDRDEYQYLVLFSGFCASLIKSNKMDEAADSLRSLTKHLFINLYKNLAGMPQSEKLRFAETLKANFDLVYSLLASDKAKNRDLTRLGLYNLLQLKGLILSDETRLYNEVRNSMDTAVTAAFGNWQTMRQILYKEYTLSPQNRLLNTDSLEALADDYERKFSAGRLSVATENQDDLIDKIRGSFSAGQAAIEFVRFNYISSEKTRVMYGAFVIKPGKEEPKFVLLCKEEVLKQLFTDAQGNWNAPDKQLTINRTTSLYKLVWKPLEPYLSKTSTIYYSPAGIINSIAINAISADNKSFLMDRYDLYFVSSTRNIAYKDQSKIELSGSSLWSKMNYSKDEYLAAGKQPAIVDSSVHHNTLPDDVVTKGRSGKEWKPITTDETEDLKAIFKSKKLILNTFEGSAATEDNIKKLTGELSGVLHISTHGFFAPSGTHKKEEAGMYTTHVNPLLRCGLVFSGANYVWSGNDPLPGKDDGILTGYEISQLDLRKVDMVVLSACETGLGDLDAGDEGVIGLQRAFRLAGAEKLVVSLWSVPPKETAELMKAFYLRLLRGEKASTALLNTQKEMRKKYTPYNWAAFVLIE